MSTFLGILELVAWAAAVVTLACAVTYAMVRIFPTREAKPLPEPDES